MLCTSLLYFLLPSVTSRGTWRVGPRSRSFRGLWSTLDGAIALWLVPGSFGAKGNWDWNRDWDWEGYNDRVRDQESWWGYQWGQGWHAKVHHWGHRNASIGHHVDWGERGQAWHGDTRVGGHHARVWIG